MQMRARVPVATLWVAPDRPRPVDRPAVADVLDAHPDDGEDGNGRLGLHGRVHTQVLAGEPVTVVGDDAAYPGWVEVVCPWQPSSLDERGYPGWLREAHLIGDDTGGHDDAPEDESWAARPGPDGRADLALAREHLGLPYLWGGTSRMGPARVATSSTESWDGCSPGTPTTSRRRPYRWMPPTPTPATCTSSPGPARRRITSGSSPAHTG